ncbi:NAD(P)/FAD-dependent oxidoreductase [Allomuricauda sp. SCSIO 65647]|uniref:NAD(P)/FAD-dependent oxidoreductase n=1 Tax=Allomuricauda sp. SCSIO 65647 TaxID=2908843 RepID=UPI001F31B960|nr:FAD-dependent oxidoreductase [Muricauda sp. SCSIO 65647]UJH66340.1 FAD-binding oxidoreductase [Muricauda sp. SCSIO 65647]
MLDYLVVGLGLAGTVFCEALEEQGKTFHVVSDDSQQASLVAGGLYNPVILKRFTMAWKADEQMKIAIPFYKKLEKKLNAQLDHTLPVLRRFASVQEQNLWFEAADKPGLERFLSPRILENDNPKIDAPFGFGQVLCTGWIDTETLIRTYASYLYSKGTLTERHFDFSGLKVADDFVSYKELNARQVVFATGYGLRRNPFFKYLPLNGTKGELLKIKCLGLNEKSIIKSSVFIIPLGQDLYRVGATYKWKDKTHLPTEAAKAELLHKVRTFLKADFEVVDHVAGIRPTVADRRPLVGRHPMHQRVYALNGFGSRGVLIGPYAANQLLGFIEKGTPLDTEMDIARFAKKYYTD